MTKLSNPVPIFYDGTGNLLDGGYIYIGGAYADPQTSALNLFWDFGQTIPAAQPLRTISGRIVNGATPSNVFFAEGDFSMRVLDLNGALVDYTATTYANTTPYQPLNASLSAIAAQGTTPYGISLLTIPNQPSLSFVSGSSTALQRVGGTMTGGILRQGAGGFTYGDTGLSPVIYAPIPSGGSAPVNPPAGSIWGFY